MEYVELIDLWTLAATASLRSVESLSICQKQNIEMRPDITNTTAGRIDSRLHSNNLIHNIRLKAIGKFQDKSNFPCYVCPTEKQI